MIRLMFGGKYDGWLRDNRSSIKRTERSPRVKKLAQELMDLRTAVFESLEWVRFVEADRERLRKKGKKETEDEIDRSVFSRVAQSLENEVLTSMRKWLGSNGWTVLVLCYDGLIVQHRPDYSVDLRAMEVKIEQDTKFALKLVEKPLFCRELPTLSLARAK